MDDEKIVIKYYDLTDDGKEYLDLLENLESKDQLTTYTEKNELFLLDTVRALRLATLRTIRVHIISILESRLSLRDTVPLSDETLEVWQNVLTGTPKMLKKLVKSGFLEIKEHTPLSFYNSFVD